MGHVAALDERTKKERETAEKRYLNSFPFHPDLSEIFYTRWTQLEGFQRTRGILRTFAIALRDAEKWDTSPLVGANVLLNEPGRNDLSEAARELAFSASVDAGDGRHQEWGPILEGELAKARAIQSDATGLRHREMEQAVISVFLNSQPIGHKASTGELIVLLGATRPDKIELEKALPSLDGNVLVPGRGGGRHGRNRRWRQAIAQIMAVGQSPQPAPDASRRMQHPCPAGSRGIADRQRNRKTEITHFRGIRFRGQGAQPAAKNARYCGRWGVSLRRSRPASGFGIR